MKYLQLLLRILVPTLLCACSAASAADLGPLPTGWYVTGPHTVANVTPENYTIGVDAATLYNGRHSAYIGSKDSATSQTFGAFAQTVSARTYLGKRVKFSAAVKTKDAMFVGLWMRIDGSRGSERFDNMGRRPICGTTDWKTYAVVLDVPQDALRITIGVLDAGKGEAWMSDPTFATTDKNTPTTDTIGSANLADRPCNLNF